MLKWSPEPFDTPAAEPTSPVVDPESFQSSGATVDITDTDGIAHLFRRESGFTDSKTLMTSLTPDERSQVYELVEMDLVEEYQEREKKIREEFEADLAETQAENSRSFDIWTGHIAEVMARELKEAADASSRLAVQIAEKIIRKSLDADPKILSRVIETILYKIPDNSPLTIQANPVDAAWLEVQPGLRERLNIAEVVADRRVEQGGCVIQAGGREWDGSLSRQLDTLAELITEMIATNEADPAAFSLPETDTETPAPDPEANNDPVVE